MLTADPCPGLYIHIPFCRAKCGYCDFYSVTSLKQYSRFIQALQTEITLAASVHHPDRSFSTIYIGGGTPSLLKPAQLSLILNTLSRYFKWEQSCEITLEINPGLTNGKQYQTYRGMGINRISIGIQSFLDCELLWLGRMHTADQAQQSYTAIRNAGFDNIGIDLIYGIPGQSLANWHYNLAKCLQLHPEHISAYNLTAESGTPLAESIQMGKDEATEIACYRSAEKILQRAGYLHYEISNYARSEAHISQHNYKYWQHAPYLGFGPSAHSFWDGQRWSNHRSLEQYCTDLESSRMPVAFAERLSRTDMINEPFLMSLRTSQGLNLRQFKQRFNYSFITKYRNAIKKLKQNRLIVVDKQYIRFTTKGMLLSDEILPSFAEN
jgi:oxygen-independent coproporphyrinogen-3 oxidase